MTDKFNNINTKIVSDSKDNHQHCLEHVPCPEFQFSTIACCTCNGYYGPCFKEPVCATCHAFLFPDDIELIHISIFSEKTDDEDSGHDEPTDLCYNTERRVSQQQNNSGHKAGASRRDTQCVLNSPQEPFLRVEKDRIQENYLVLQKNVNNDIQNSQSQNLLKEVFSSSDDFLASIGVTDSKSTIQCPWDCDLSPEIREPSRPTNLLERPEMLTNNQDIKHEPSNDSELVERLPPEVLLTVFSYLDDLSLWSAVNVCRRWYGLLSTHVTSQQWQRHVILRWPLYRPVSYVTDWYKIYDQLILSTPCKMCLIQTSLQMKLPRIEENSWRRNRLQSELKGLKVDPPEGIEATPMDQMCYHWQATITGPAGSPYEGGLFFLYLQVPHSYPMRPPVVRFLTRILHPNVSRHGDVGIDSIHHNWSLALTISKVLISVQSLLTDPYCQVCMEPELGEMYVKDKDKFEEIARLWTWKYAMQDVIMPT